MASPVLPNTSNFLGVALVVNRSRDGPQFVFHYPPRILDTGTESRRRARIEERGGGDDSGRSDREGGAYDDGFSAFDEDEDDDEDVDDDDVLLNPMHYSALEAQAGGTVRNSVDLQNWNHDDHLETDSGSHIVPWDHVAGFPTKDLESLLTPARAFHKKRFQVSLDQLFCASYPVFVPENGIWRKTKKKRQQQQQQQQPQPQPPPQPGKSPENGDAANKSDTPLAPPSDITQTEPRVAGEDGVSPNQADEAEEKKSGMTMFNLVFILNPKKHEARELVDTLYFHIIKKVNKAYKYSQQRCDFVWKESKKILALKDKGREARTKMSTLWREVLEVSSLAASMQDIYEAVSHNKIAALQLETAEGAVTHSVQIPAPFCLADLPAHDEPGSRGLWITTAHSFVAEENIDDPSFLDKNFALLLLSDEKKIVAELQADTDDTTAAMVEFVRLSRPTLSFHQIGHGNALSPAQVRKYAQHFIFWRRAIAIPPLHARDVYVLSPNCDAAGLPRASQAWARAFPLAPPLPGFLADLSAAPRPYKWHAPSKNHRPAYLAMLAWLLRGGWVTQLCTFAYVVVWPEILYEVEYQLEADELRGQQQQQQQLLLQASSSASALASVSASSSPDSSSSTATVSASATAAAAAAAASRPATATSDGHRGSGGLGFAAAGEASMPSPSLTSPALTEPPPPPPPSSSSRPLTASSSGGGDHHHHHHHHPSPTLSTTAMAQTTSPTPTTTIGEQVAEKARLERMADKASREAAEKAAAHARKPVPVATAHPSLNEAPHLAGLAPHVIVDAKKATGKDSLYLSAIGRRFGGGGGDGSRNIHNSNNSNSNSNGNGNGNNTNHTANNKGGGDSNSNNNTNNSGSNHSHSHSHHHSNNLKVQKAWPVFWKYFNGRSALERVALQEDMKRKEAWNLLTAMSEYLLCVRHW